MRTITLADIWESVRERFSAFHNYKKDHSDEA